MTLRRPRSRHPAARDLGLLIALAAPPLLAAPAAESARAASGYLAQLVGGLVLVILTILVMAWILRRMPGMAGQGRQVIEILAVRAVGTRERLMLVQVGEEQILVGLTPTGMRHLHTLRTPVVVAPVEPRAGEFASLLQRARSQWAGK
ncbi:flagellar biosynthetic protein FliO [Thiocystis violascens]|uniref:Flagellar protein n=1 Tax=Thiocystis violascens (strain ATCC 17096 / DSM 198 / 6111) TaxID=765911 RepID=U3GJJ3_THIV6|nr:flagellar biosynthetic protein FliO [Thiocystis violascens]AFL72436.1 flagellar biosynthetic protein FliO [Thiocystis violascens DSM 198]